MLDPTFNSVITVFHQQKMLDVVANKNILNWDRKVYEECYFDVQRAENVEGNTLKQASSYTAKIPFDGVELNIAEGDIVVLGKVLDEITDVSGARATDLINKYKPNCFTVRTVSANTKIPEDAHYKLTGV